MIQHHIFTLQFKAGASALLHVYGEQSQDHAREFAASVFPECTYIVLDGDQTGGTFCCFYSWTSAQAQEHFPHTKKREVTLCR